MTLALQPMNLKEARRFILREHRHHTMGYRRMGTYLLKREPGTSVVAAGWKMLYETTDRPKGWDTPSRPRVVSAPTEAKTFWAPAECAQWFC